MASRTIICDGGIINNAQSSAVLTVASRATLRNSVIDGDGGAIHAIDNTTVYLTGSEISGNVATGNGAGIYLAENSVLYLSGDPNFGGAGVDAGGNLDASAGNFSTSVTLATDARNGGKAYLRARQDIFIAGAADSPHTAIQVSGAITSGDGTIWVWADRQEHYDMLKQFAVFSGAGTGLAEDVRERSMKAFRNARPDSDTNCGGDYLTGQKGEIANWIYWTGGFDAVFMKTDGFGQGLSGAYFTLYTDENCTNEFKMSFSDGTKRASTVSSDGTATYNDKDGTTVTLQKGEVLLSKVPPKTFFMKETQAPDGYQTNNTVYRVTISDKGALTLEMKETGAYEEVYKVKTKAASGSEPAEYQYRILNFTSAERKVLLRKVSESAFAPLSGVKFEIERIDGTLVEGTDINGATTTTFTSGASGVYFIGKLPYGEYTLHEVEKDGSMVDISFTLTVKDDTATLTGSRDGVAIKAKTTP